jgi:hypothetical protein
MRSTVALRFGVCDHCRRLSYFLAFSFPVHCSLQPLAVDIIVNDEPTVKPQTVRILKLYFLGQKRPRLEASIFFLQSPEWSGPAAHFNPYTKWRQACRRQNLHHAPHPRLHTKLA